MKRSVLGVSCCLLLATGSSWAGKPNPAVPYSGYLTENGIPVNGIRVFTFTLHPDSTSPAVLAAPTQTESLQVLDGVFQTQLRFSRESWSSATGSPSMEVAVDGVGSLGSVEIGVVPNAMSADHADVASALADPPDLPGLGTTDRSTAITLTITNHLTQQGWVQIDAVTLQVPADGYVWVTTDGSTGLFSGTSCGWLQLGESPPGSNRIGLEICGTSTSMSPYSITRVFQATAGNHTYRLYGQAGWQGISSGSMTLEHLNLHAMWLPNRFQP